MKRKILRRNAVFYDIHALHVCGETLSHHIHSYDDEIKSPQHVCVSVVTDDNIVLS